jgi:hypothetical protein
MMQDDSEQVGQRAERIRREEGISHGRNPEAADPEMLEGEEADVVRANKAISRGEGRPQKSDDPQDLTPDERFPPD